jgi:XTP/dITP diphosphohydrolase
MLAVSRTKAMQAFEIVAWPVLVDDSGIYFSAYPDFPGVFSKYMFHSLGRDGLRRLFVDQPNTHAYFQCVLSYMDETLQEPCQFIWRVDWTLDFTFLDKVTINSHLPYDAIFRAEGMDVIAQLAMPVFEQIHHRAKATELCKIWLQKRI